MFNTKKVRLVKTSRDKRGVKSYKNIAKSLFVMCSKSRVSNQDEITELKYFLASH